MVRGADRRGIGEAANEDGGATSRQGEVEDRFGREALEGLEAHPVWEHGRREVCRRAGCPRSGGRNYQRGRGGLFEESRQAHEGEIGGCHVEEAAAARLILAAG